MHFSFFGIRKSLEPCVIYAKKHLKLLKERPWIEKILNVRIRYLTGKTSLLIN